MGLSLGKTFNRNYVFRIPVANDFYDVNIFFNKKSNFLLFRVDPVISRSKNSTSSKISMFKNIEGSKFSKTFLELNNYQNKNLTITNQFKNIKPDLYDEINFVMNEHINIAKHYIDGRELYDTMTIYGFTITSCTDEYFFMIAERQHIVKRLNKKVVTTSGLEISSLNALNILEDFYKEGLSSGKEGTKENITNRSNGTIKLSDVSFLQQNKE